MAHKNLINSEILTATPTNLPAVDSNGTFRLYESAKIDSPNSENGLEVVITYKGMTPDPSNGGTNFRVSAIIETEDIAGNWHPFHSQYESFVRPADDQNDQKHIIKCDPKIFNLDEGVINDVSDGFAIVARESRKQALLPDDFRVVILLSENGFGTTGAFQSIPVTISYLTYAI